MVNEYIASNTAKQWFATMDMQAVGGTPDDLQEFIAARLRNGVQLSRPPTATVIAKGVKACASL
jgi:hypothetical protein